MLRNRIKFRSVGRRKSVTVQIKWHHVSGLLPCVQKSAAPLGSAGCSTTVLWPAETLAPSWWFVFPLLSNTGQEELPVFMERKNNISISKVYLSRIMGFMMKLYKDAFF